MRDRFNARQFISWIQDVDDKYDRMKVRISLVVIFVEILILHVLIQNLRNVTKNVTGMVPIMMYTA